MTQLAKQFVIVLALSTTSFATDIAILRNGFSIRHERHEEIGTITRLFLSTDGANFADVPTLQIDHFEKDLFAPKPEPAVAKPETINEVITATSQRHSIDPDLVTSVI